LFLEKRNTEKEREYIPRIKAELKEALNMLNPIEDKADDI
tara:strand:+ start:444 stop:563 length:120 start_codon:yes stop_codon:yes gene_type:complete